MKFKQKQRLSADLIESIMLNRGINNIDLYLNPTNENDTVLSEIPNISETIKTFQKNIGNDILILVDSDADGMTSAAIMYKYLKFVNPFAKVRYFIHEHKTHGLTPQFMEHVRDTKPAFIIVPDAGTNDIEQREEVVSMGIDLLVIDHHNEDKTTDKGGILINNHANYPKNDINKHFTGAGMTYLVCKALDKFLFNTGKIEFLKDLAMVGMIGDCALILENEIRNLCINALKDINSNMIKNVIDENKQDIDKVTFMDMQYGGIIPLINSIVRIGTVEEKELMFKALADIETDCFTVVEKRKLNKETRKYEKVPFKLNIYQLASDTARSCKARQDKIVAEEMKLADKQFNPNTGIQVYVVQTDECKPLTGLLANKLTSKWQQPVIAVWEIDGCYSGSLRGWEKTLSNFKQWCEGTGLFNLVQGHGNAAGVVFDLDKLEQIRKCGENLEPEEIYYEVDAIYNEKASFYDVMNVGQNIHLFKNGVEEPLFAVTNLQLTQTNAKWSKNTMRIYMDGITYIKFKVSEDEFNELIEEQSKIDIIGKFSINEWNGRQYPQFMIEDYEKVEEQPLSINFGIFA